jgi:preprotein translocase subunit SecB
VEAQLKFNKYTVDHMYYKRNLKYWEKIDSKENIKFKLHPKFLFDVVYTDDNYKSADVIVGVKIGEELKDEDIPFIIEIILRGSFTFDYKEDKEKKEEIINFYKQNAIAILFPYLRSLVTDLTSKSDHPPIMLPTINIIKVAEEYFENTSKTYN